MINMLARVELKYGTLLKFNEILSHLKPVLESKGWRMVGAWQVTVGQLNTVYDLWEMEDATAINSVLRQALKEPEFAKWAAKLSECVQVERLEVLDKLPYSP